MEKLGKERYRLSDSETLEKRGTEWRIIRPWFKESEHGFKTGNIIWKNFLYGGSVSNIVYTFLAVVIILFIAWSYNNDTQECRELLEELSIQQNLLNKDNFPMLEYNNDKETTIFNPSVSPQDTSR